VQVFNLSKGDIRVDFRNMKGHWLSSSIESSQLKKQGVVGDSTYLYLVSAGDFAGALN